MPQGRELANKLVTYNKVLAASKVLLEVYHESL